jgi:hypothetical protein
MSTDCVEALLDSNWQKIQQLTERMIASYLIPDLDLAREVSISSWVVQHLPRCILHASQGNHLGLQVVRGLVEGCQRTSCSIKTSAVDAIV